VVGAFLGALAICMALPALNPACGMSSLVGPSVAGCGAVESWVSGGFVPAGLIVGGAIAMIVAASVAWQALRHRQVAESLKREARPALVADQRVGLVPGTGLILVAGIRDPQIYCSADILGRLEPEELRAVLLHERHHALSHAPTRLILLSALAHVVGRIRTGHAWLERERARIEIAADAHALGNGATRPALARAILKLQTAPPDPSLAGFASASDLRIGALLGEHMARERSAPRLLAATILAATVGALLCSILAIS
jgi:beta-lactamase regulating signal transducer with metallopeptidase domain